MAVTKIDMATFGSLKEMTGGEFLQGLIDTYFSDATSLLAEMASALTAGDAPRFGRAAHSLKGNSATFGATALAEKARELEFMGKGGNLEGASPKLEALTAEYQLVRSELEALRDGL